MSSPARKPPAAAASSGFPCEWAIAQPAFESCERVVEVLSVSPLAEDHQLLEHIFSHTNWRLLRATSLSGALSVLRQCAIPVVICECDLAPGTWKDMLQATAELARRPLLIVASRLADDHLWAEALNFGAYDVLEKPFHREEVTRVVRLAWLRWRDLNARPAEGRAAKAAVAGYFW